MSGQYPKARPNNRLKLRRAARSRPAESGRHHARGALHLKKMAKITIEPEGSAEHSPCADCGSTTRSVWGYAYQDEACLAAYFAAALWTEGILSAGSNCCSVSGVGVMGRPLYAAPYPGSSVA